MENTAKNMIEIAGKADSLCKSIADKTGNELSAYRPNMKVEANKREHEYLSAFFDELKQISESDVAKTAKLGFIGEMSSGKSALVNMILGYPLFPSAELCTSDCPVEVVYGEKTSLDVFTYTENAEGVDNEQKLFSTKDRKISDEEIKVIAEYVSDLITKGVLICENIAYYHDTSDAESLIPEDEVQLIQLLIIPLTGAISPIPKNKEMIEKRREILSDIFRISPDTPYGLRVTIKSSMLANGLTLIDLPGLGSDNQTHRSITLKYLSRADCYVVLFESSAKVFEQSSVLNDMGKYNSMKSAGKNSRFIAAINKCDLAFAQADDDDDFSKKMASTVRAIRGKITQIDVSTIYPVSARYAEIRLINEGNVKPERTKQWKAIARQRRGGPDAIPAIMEEDYHYSFSYTDPDSNSRISCSSADFVEDLIGKYAARIRMINVYDEIREFCSTFDRVESSLEIQLAMLELLGASGDEMMKEMIENIDDSFIKSRERFYTSLQTLEEEMINKQKELTTSMGSVVAAYSQKLGEAQGDIIALCDNYFNRMLPDWANHIIIDGKDEKSAVNLSLYDELMDEKLGNYDFSPYLSAGDNLLNEQLEKQREVYNDCTQSIKNCFNDLTSDCTEDLIKTFKEFEQKLIDKGVTEELRNIYKDCFDKAIKAITGHLGLLGAQMSNRLDSDDTIENEINVTIDNIRLHFAEMQDWYHHECKAYISKNKEPTFWRERPSLNDQAIKECLKNHLSSDRDNSGYVDKLPDLLTRQDEKKCHSERILKALSVIIARFSREYEFCCDSFFPSITAGLRNTFINADMSLESRFTHLKGIAEKMYKSVEAFAKSEDYNNLICFSNDNGVEQHSAAAASESINYTMKAFSGFIAKVESAKN